MKQVLRNMVNYTSDLSGICSALYELGGLIVMHDASGCNSTYATHDEPRWYDTHSLIYISALEEYDAVLGNDDKLIHDVMECALDQHPKFIALFGSPIALMTGTDFRGIAHLIEEETGIPTFGFKTSGMRSYISGARQAFAAIADRFCPAPADAAVPASSPAAPIKVNLLGVTPLDFSVVGNVEALHQFLADHGFEEVSCWAMGSTLEDLMRAGEADVNLVVSSSALDAAKILEQKYGTPYVAGVPIGSAGADAVAAALRAAALPASRPASRILHATGERPARSWTELFARTEARPDLVLVGEAASAASLRFALEQQFAARSSAGAPLPDIRVICPVEEPMGVLRSTDLLSDEEEDMAPLLRGSKAVLADPLYERVLRKPGASEAESPKLIRFPDEAFSGRMFRTEIPVFIGPAFDTWLDEHGIG